MCTERSVAAESYFTSKAKMAGPSRHPGPKVAMTCALILDHDISNGPWNNPNSESDYMESLDEILMTLTLVANLAIAAKLLQRKAKVHKSDFRTTTMSTIRPIISSHYPGLAKAWKRDHGDTKSKSGETYHTEVMSTSENCASTA